MPSTAPEPPSSAAAGAWLFVHPPSVTLPPEWRDRAEPALIVPLLPGEASRLLAGEPVTPTLSAAEAELVRLAASGRTVVSMARDLGVNKRTVDRRLAALRERLGVASTAEMAVAAAACGFSMSSDTARAVTGRAPALPNGTSNTSKRGRR